MFDEYRILTTEQFWEAQILENCIKAKQPANHIILDKQLPDARQVGNDGLDRFVYKRNRDQKTGMI